MTVITKNSIIEWTKIHQPAIKKERSDNMEKEEMTMILQAIKELSDKVDQNSESLLQLSDKVDQNSESLQQLLDKVDYNHETLTKRLDNLDDTMEEKMEYMQHKLVEHDELLFKLKRRKIY